MNYRYKLIFSANSARIYDNKYKCYLNHTLYGAVFPITIFCKYYSGLTY